MNDTCQHFRQCGGCDFQDIPYAEQLKRKRFLMSELFARFENVQITDVVPSPRIWYYRNKMEYAVGGGTRSCSIGLREKRKFHKIVDVKECRIFAHGVERITSAVKEWMASYDMEPYDIRRHSGKIRYVALRHSKTHDEMIVIVVAAMTPAEFEEERGAFAALADRLKTIGCVRSVYAALNEALADVAVSDAITLLYGKGHIEETINDIKYAITPQAFFQTNSFCCGELYGVLKAQTRHFGQDALDIYCGTGGIALQVSRNFRRIIGVDNSQENIDAACLNAKVNAIDNAAFVCADAEEFLSKRPPPHSLLEVSTVFVDPPRPGLGRKTMAALLESGAPHLVYVSCNPRSLAADLAELVRVYRLEKIIPVDMFPHTTHCEAVAVLSNER